MTKETRSTRLFVVSRHDRSCVLQSNSVESPHWFSGPGTERKYEHLEDTFGSGRLFTFVRNYGDALRIPRGHIADTTLWTFETTMVHPRDSKVRFSVVGVFLRGDLSYVAYVREERDVDFFPSLYWSGPESQISTKHRKEKNGKWRCTSACVNRNGECCSTVFEKVLSQFPKVQNSERFALELFDDVTITAPLNLISSTLNEMCITVFWNVDSKTAKESVLYFDENGMFERECLNTFEAVQL